MDTENAADLLKEPLLAPSTPSAAARNNESAEDPTPLRYFLHENDDSDDDEEEIESITTEDLERDIQLTALRILGKPFSRKFWILDLPVAALLGGLLGGATLLFLAAVHASLNLWFPLDSPDQAPKKDFWWLTVTTLGGFACGLLLLHPKAPSVGTVRTMFHDASDLQGHPAQALFVVLACYVSLATGAPLGPEMAIGAMGSGLASLLSRLLKVNRRTEAGWVVSGMAGSLGGLFPSPILGVTLTHELSVVGRPHSLTLDAVATTETDNEEQRVVDHDFMEQVTLAGTSATCAYLVLHALLPKITHWHYSMDIGNEYHMWHLAVAIPLGLLCGFVASVALIFLGAFRTIRSKTCEFLHERLGAPKVLGRILFPTLAGVLHGLLAIWNPYLVSSGIPFVSQMIENHDSMRPGWLLLLGFGKSLSMSLCLGFGLVGGPLFPMVFVGLCIGLALSSFTPLSLAVPCCMCATVGSFVPIPFTLVVYVALVFSLTAEQMGPVFVATFVAYALTGGLGVIRRMGERRLGYFSMGDDLMMFDAGPSDLSILQGIRYTIFGRSNE